MNATPDAKPAGAWPQDLREWMGSTPLVCLVLEAVEAVPMPSALCAFGSENGGRHTGKMLLSVLTYAYACGISTVREIEELSSDEPGLKYLCARYCPDADVLLKFRRTALALVKESLYQAFWMAWVRRQPTGMGNPSSSAELVVMQHHALVEAGRRLQRAIFSDSMALDV